MKQENPFAQSIIDIKEMQERYKKAAMESEDVKNGNCTPEEELQEPGSVLYNQIAESSISILQQPQVAKIFADIGKDVGDDVSKRLVELMAIIMTQSAYSAVVFYDEMLKKEMTKQFDNIGHHINLCKSDIEGHAGALSVFKKQLDEINRKIKIDIIKKNNDIQ